MILSFNYYYVSVSALSVTPATHLQTDDVFAAMMSALATSASLM